MLFDPRVNKPALYLGYATASAVFGAYLYFTVMIAPTMKGKPSPLFATRYARRLPTLFATSPFSLLYALLPCPAADIPDNAFERVAPRTIYTATACAVISFIRYVSHLSSARLRPQSAPRPSWPCLPSPVSHVLLTRSLPLRSFTIAAWPVWRFTSIVLVSVTYIAVMFAPNLVPNF
jgi:hypothetical protein